MPGGTDRQVVGGLTQRNGKATEGLYAKIPPLVVFGISLGVLLSLLLFERYGGVKWCQDPVFFALLATCAALAGLYGLLAHHRHCMTRYRALPESHQRIPLPASDARLALPATREAGTWLPNCQTALLDGISRTILLVDDTGQVTFANRAAADLFQRDQDAMVGMPMSPLLGPSAAPAVLEGRSDIEAEGRTGTGKRFPAQVAVTPLPPQSDFRHRYALEITDLTPRRALDLQLMHSARLATLGEMAASIAHEFNHCLHVINLSAESLQADLLQPNRLSAQIVQTRTNNILAQVERLSEMILHMRTLSRRETGGKEMFHPRKALDAALRMIEPLLAEERITLKRNGDPGEIQIRGHQVRLEQVLLNLLKNARDAISDRSRRQKRTGGTITVNCGVDDKNKRLKISVQDDGLGVPADMSRHIFEAFFTTKQDGNGCGLGLSISRSICTELGGSLTLENTNAGAVFTVELPLASTIQEVSRGGLLAERTTPPPSHEDDFDDVLNERRVLVVDDEALPTMMVREFLERQGYVADTAFDGLAALEKCQQRVYHAVITDIRMPRLDGRLLIRKLAELQPGTPVIVVTGHLKEADMTDLGDNVLALMEKPFQLKDLYEHLLRA